MSFSIYDKSGNEKISVQSITYNDSAMGECSVSVDVRSSYPIEWEIGDYMMYRDERFEINYDPSVIKKAAIYTTGDAFTYEGVKFNALSDELVRCDFLDVVLEGNLAGYTNMPNFAFYCETVNDLVDRINANLMRLYKGDNIWNVYVHPEFKGKEGVVISASNNNVWEALEWVNTYFGANFTIKNRTIIVGFDGSVVSSVFQQGKDKGLVKITRTADSSQAVVTRLRVYGNTTNLPYRYYNNLTDADLPNNLAVNHLMLPDFPDVVDPYLESETAEIIGVREDSVFFDGSDNKDDIYPTIQGMTADELIAAGIETTATGNLDEIVSAEQIEDDGIFEGGDNIPAFTITVKDLGFDINDHLSSESAKISMKDGMCGGREFEIVECVKDEESGNYILTCNRSEDTGLGLYFPYKYFNIQKDDKFVLLGIEMPDVYIKAASQRLKAAGIEYLAKNDKVRYTYELDVDSKFMYMQHVKALKENGESIHDTIKAGQLIVFKDDDLGIDYSVFIDTLEIKEEDGSIPKYSITLREEKQVGNLQRIQEQIDSIVSGATSVKGSGGSKVNIEQIKGLIKAYGSSLFLQKNSEDTANKKITFKEGISSEGDMIIGDFLRGVLGRGGAITLDENGSTTAEFDFLNIRRTAYFRELTIVEMKHIGGELVLTPAAIVVSDVDTESFPRKYRVYFDTTDGTRTIHNPFIVGDLARCQRFDIGTGTSEYVRSHYYWRKVVSVGENYIDLSTRAGEFDEGSGIPMVGDNIVLLGSAEPSRQAAIILSAVENEAPSKKFYAGINSFSLVDREVTAEGYISRTGRAYQTIYGDFYVGNREQTKYVKYDKKGLHILADDISLKTPSGARDLGKFVNDKAQEAFSELNSLITNQFDGSFEIWRGDTTAEPSLDRLPSYDWNTPELLKEHEGDYYINTEGRVWQFIFAKPKNEEGNEIEGEEGSYTWELVTDENLISCLNLVKEKRRIFSFEITNNASVLSYFLNRAYEKGDVWVNATWIGNDSKKVWNKDTLVCISPKEAGQPFQISDWASSSDINSQKLLDTGIDIANNQITITAEKTLIRSNTGLPIAMFDVFNGVPRLKTDFFYANRVAVAEEKIMLNTDGSGKLASGKINWNANGEMTIAGWKIDATTISKNNVSLGADGTISAKNGTTTYWELKNDGSGSLACGSIEWTNDGYGSLADGAITWDADGLSVSGHIEASSGSFTGIINATDGKFSGEIISSKGTIGGWTIAENGLYNGNVWIDSDGDIWCGEEFEDASWALLNDGSGWLADKAITWDSTNGLKVEGEIVATKITLGKQAFIEPDDVRGGISAVGQSGKYEDLTGKPNIPKAVSDLTGATNLIYASDISVTDKTINGVKVRNIKVGTSNYSIFQYDDFVLTDIGYGDGTTTNGKTYAKISTNGLLTAYNAIIYGQINATSGAIGGWEISNGTLSNGSTHIDSDGDIWCGTSFDNASWRLVNDGSGWVANGNISWNADGGVSMKGQLGETGDHGEIFQTIGAGIGSDYLIMNGTQKPSITLRENGNDYAEVRFMANNFASMELRADRTYNNRFFVEADVSGLTLVLNGLPIASQASTTRGTVYIGDNGHLMIRT